MRKASSIAALFFVAVTAVIVFSRLRSATGDNLSFTVSFPLLAGLGVLPVAAPSFIFWVEMLGTARILTTVHPYTGLTKSKSADETNDNDDDVSWFPESKLLLQYLAATLMARLSLWGFARSVNQFVCSFRYNCFGLSSPGISSEPGSKLVRIPPASQNVLEKLGFATAFCLVDDELACEPDSIPQQLLIPAASGLKLLDLCPTYDDESGEESDSDTLGRRRGRSFDSDSSEDDDATVTQTFHSALRRKILRRRRIRRRAQPAEDDDRNTKRGDLTEDDTDDSAVEVQFEDPKWWQHLPTLKCIGLAGLVIDEPLYQHHAAGRGNYRPVLDELSNVDGGKDTISDIDHAKSSLVRLVCSERRSNQLRALAQCIGFTTEQNTFGERGDLSPFTERLRLHVLSSALFQERIEIDSHERSSEQSRWWGLLRPDCTSVIVQDSRSKAYQLLTVGKFRDSTPSIFVIFHLTVYSTCFSCT